VRLSAAVTSATRLTFCTTGILLRRIAGNADLAGVSHVIVDEVHERTVQGDFLLAILRRLVKKRERTPHPLKIVLMSATVDLTMLVAYFGGCACLEAEGRAFPVEHFFLEDVYAMTGYRLEGDAPAALRRCWNGSKQLKAQKQGGAPSHSLCACPIRGVLRLPASHVFCCLTWLHSFLYYAMSVGQLDQVACVVQASRASCCRRGGATTCNCNQMPSTATMTPPCITPLSHMCASTSHALMSLRSTLTCSRMS
jgi:hypothetical protein